MFENLSDRLQNVMHKIKGYGKITEENINEMMREIRLSLLEADVNYKVVKEFTNKVLDELITAINANNIERNLCIMGGEPLCPENEFLTNLIITEIKKAYPTIKVYIWTGYVYDDLKKSNNIRIKNILKIADYLIDGPFIQEERDVTLHMRGSRNQRIINLKLDKEENL